MKFPDIEPCPCCGIGECRLDDEDRDTHLWNVWCSSCRYTFGDPESVPEGGDLRHFLISEHNRYARIVDDALAAEAVEEVVRDSREAVA